MLMLPYALSVAWLEQWAMLYGACFEAMTAAGHPAIHAAAVILPFPVLAGQSAGPVQRVNARRACDETL